MHFGVCSCIFKSHCVTCLDVFLCVYMSVTFYVSLDGSSSASLSHHSQSRGHHAPQEGSCNSDLLLMRFQGV